MKNEHVTVLLPEYLDGILNDAKSNEVEEHLAACEACSKALEELKTLFKVMSEEATTIPSDHIRVNFLEQLEKEKEESAKVVQFEGKTKALPRFWATDLFKVAAGMALLVSVFFMGKYQSEASAQKEIARLTAEKSDFQQTAMLSLMENKSASRRIQGVNYIEELNEPDEAIVKALADRMLYDENVNVRAAAVDVLARFTSSDSVKSVFIEALKIEKDPGIQIAIIQTLGQIQEKKAAEPLQRLLEQEETQPFVKEHIESILPNII